MVVSAFLACCFFLIGLLPWEFFSTAMLLNQQRPFVDRLELEDLHSETLHLLQQAKDCYERDNKVRKALNDFALPTSEDRIDGATTATSTNFPPTTNTSSTLSAASSSSTSSWLAQVLAQDWRHLPNHASPGQVLECYLQVLQNVDVRPRTTLAQSRIYFAVKTYAWEYFQRYYEWIYHLHKEGIEEIQDTFLEYANALKETLTLRMQVLKNERLPKRFPHLMSLHYQHEVGPMPKLLAMHKRLCLSGHSYESNLYSEDFFPDLFQRHVDTHRLQDDFDASSSLCNLEPFQAVLQRREALIREWHALVVQKRNVFHYTLLEDLPRMQTNVMHFKEVWEKQKSNASSSATAWRSIMASHLADISSKIHRMHILQACLVFVTQGEHVISVEGMASGNAQANDFWTQRLRSMDDFVRNLSSLM